MSRQILFLCTGNYYRSRFAEIVFNYLAGRSGIAYVASSRALAVELGIYNVGPISAFTRKALESRGIALPDPTPFPRQCDEAELQSAYRVIALKEAEHRPYLARRYPGWADRVEYWHIHDLDQSTPDEALSEIEQKVAVLVEQLRAESDKPTGDRDASTQST